MASKASKAAAAEQAAIELEQHFERLHQLIGQNQHAKIVKLADTILKLAPGDVDALGCKAVAYLQLGEYEEAAKVLAARQLAGQMQFERAYCCYRLGKFEEALKLLAEVPEDEEAGALQLAAQVQFRLDDGAACVEACDKLRALGPLSLEQQTNAVAAYVSAGLSAKLPDLMARLGVKARDGFEVAFNRACGLLAAGDAEGAEAAVKAAYKQGEEALLDEDFTEEEVLGELAPLTVLLAFLLVQSGRPEAALDKLQPLVAGELPQREVAALAANNWAVACFHTGAQQKGFYSRSIRKLESLLDRSPTAAPLALDRDVDTRLSAEQKQLLHLNRALLYLLSGKLDQARELGDQLAKAFPGSVNVDMLRAVLLAKDGKAAEADARLAEVQARVGAGADGPEEEARPTLLRAQLALEAGDAAAALRLLSRELPEELRLRPGVLATRVALHEQTGDAAGAEALLQSALQHWQREAAAAPRDAEAAAGVGWCLQRLVSLKLSRGAAGEAMSLYQQLSKLGGASASTGSAALAKLARAAAAAGDADAVRTLQKQLPPAYTSLGEGLDVDALEDSWRSLGGGRRRDDAAGGRKRDADDAAEGAPRPKKSKKKRKSRYPQGYDPSLPNGGLPVPDPERWLPKWQRSDAKKKQRRRRDRQETVKGSQGAGKVDDALDRAAKAERGEEPDKAKAPAKPNLPPRPAGKGGGKGGRR